MTLGYVYFVESGEFIKIGYSKSPKRRMCELGTLRPSCFVLKLVGLISGTQADEKALHAKFAAHRDNGEWFRCCDEIRAYIDAHCAVPLPTQPAAIRMTQKRAKIDDGPKVKRPVGRPPTIYRCGSCGKIMNLSDNRHHVTICLKRPGLLAKKRKEKA